MHRDYSFRLEKVAGVGGLARSHGEVIADGQHDDFGSVKIADDRHIAEDIGVAGMVDLNAVLELDDVAAGFAAVDQLVAILDAAGVIGVDHGDFDVAEFLRAAFIHHGGLLCALLLQPSAHFGNTDDLGIVLVDDLDGVSNVVSVTMCALEERRPSSLSSRTPGTWDCP